VVPGKPNVGLKLTADQVASRIRSLEGPDYHKVAYRVADPACWKRDGGPSIAEQMYKSPSRLLLKQADNTRLAGWSQVRNRLSAPEHPMLVTFDTCVDFVRTFPALQHDHHRPEDVDSDGEDHAGDDTRYACMSRPYTLRAADAPKTVRAMRDMTFDEAIALAKPRSLSLDGRL
jgi:hypothetical protein